MAKLGFLWCFEPFCMRALICSALRRILISLPLAGLCALQHQLASHHPDPRYLLALAKQQELPQGLSFARAQRHIIMVSFILVAISSIALVPSAATTLDCTTLRSSQALSNLTTSRQQAIFLPQHAEVLITSPHASRLCRLQILRRYLLKL